MVASTPAGVGSNASVEELSNLLAEERAFSKQLAEKVKNQAAELQRQVRAINAVLVSQATS